MAEAGRYKVDGYRLTLVDDNGQRENLSLFLPDASDGLLVVNGNNYLRRDRR